MSKAHFVFTLLVSFLFVFAVVTTVNDEDYVSLHWPKLEGAIQLILQQNPGEFIPISYEEMYRYATIQPRPSSISNLYLSLSLNLFIKVCQVILFRDNCFSRVVWFFILVVTSDLNMGHLQFICKIL